MSDKVCIYIHLLEAALHISLSSGCSLSLSLLGLAQFTLTDMELALQFCTHVIYGYAGINPDTYEMKSLNQPLDFERRHFAQITALKDKYPYIKFLLSVGGDRDLEDDKYVRLLEAGAQAQTRFINSARDVVRRFNFDGLDLAFQLPRNKPRKHHSDAGMAWKSFKKFFTGDFIVDPNAEAHKGQMTNLIKDLNSALKANDLLFSLTVLPNVNSSCKFVRLSDSRLSSSHLLNIYRVFRCTCYRWQR